jgi:hypothetical protein
VVPVLIGVNWLLVLGLLGALAIVVGLARHARRHSWVSLAFSIVILCALAYQATRWSQGLILTADADRTLTVYNPWGIPVQEIEPGEWRTMRFGTRTTALSVDERGRLITDMETVPVDTQVVHSQLLVVETTDGAWSADERPSAMEMGYNDHEIWLLHSSLGLPPHFYDGERWQFPELEAAEWLATEAQPGASCRVFWKGMWFDAQLLTPPEEGFVRVHYDGRSTQEDGWIPVYLAHPSEGPIPSYFEALTYTD